MDTRRCAPAVSRDFYSFQFSDAGNEHRFSAGEETSQIYEPHLVELAIVL